MTEEAERVESVETLGIIDARRSRNVSHNSGLEVSHWFDQCDVNSFERAGSKPTVSLV